MAHQSLRHLTGKESGSAAAVVTTSGGTQTIPIKLEGKPITHKEAKEIIGKERFERFKAEAEAGFWEDPLVCQAFYTPKGMMVFTFN